MKTVNDDVTKLKNSLGTAAGKNVQESGDDITPGRVLVNGGAIAVRTVRAKAGEALADASALPANSVSFCYADAAYSPGYEATILDVGGGGGNYRVQYAASYGDGGKQLKFRALNGDNGYWGSWTSVITNYGGSVDYLDGARYYATKPESWQGGGAFANQYNDGSAPFFVGGYTTPKDNSVYLPIVKGTSQTNGYGYGAAVSFGILRSGLADFGSAIIQILGDNGAGSIYSFNANGDFNSPGQVSSGGNIVAGQGLYESGGAVRAYSSNNPPTQYALKDWITTVGLSSNNPAYPYMRQESSGAVIYLASQDWVNGSFATHAWTIANFGMVNGIRRGGQQLQNPTDAWFGNWESPAGCVVTGITMDGRSDGRKLGVYYRQMQYFNIQSQTWINIGD
ncbi:hypothetical protein RVO90_16455 [Enterobacter chengduensis]|uniref:hypothetical protein n=1 Tax=Enterobacter chengduensis TaxID=2494701 RepID=UPI002929E583|nr:hypothetical protein [Enterobacter chengduensis]MDV0367542.1 hypothetical protein [Enterobacter chengduensis]